MHVVTAPVICRNTINTCLKIPWHSICLEGGKVWGRPGTDTIVSFVKPLMYGAGLLPQIWFAIVTPTTNLLLNSTVTGCVSLVYIALTVNQRLWDGLNPAICTSLSVHPAHMQYMEQLWRLLHSFSSIITQQYILTTPRMQYRPMQGCMQTVVFLQFALGFVLPNVVLYITQLRSRQFFLAHMHHASTEGSSNAHSMPSPQDYKCSYSHVLAALLMGAAAAWQIAGLLTEVFAPLRTELAEA